ncbi:MAG: DUF58 domain-containing protein [Myxococcaceae bacterium]|nr:DUF58 domain-containing protein [Myxococcaceae bacterium]MCA3015921.1 DUF58 domain-containing protein [Myxococcaceae bacterium]
MNPDRVLRVTPMGRVYLVLTLGVGVGALNTGNNLLYLVLAFLLSSIIVSGVLSERVVRDLTVRRLLPDGAFAHEPFPIRYELRRRRGHAFAVAVREASTLMNAGAFAAVVSAAGPTVVRATALAPRRGPWALAAVEVSTTFPFGIFEKKRTIALADTLLVYPRRGFACEVSTAGQRQVPGDASSGAARGGTADVADLRELVPGEDARRVHWRRSAALGKPVVVVREREERRQHVLRVDPTTPSEALDSACEAAAGQARRLLADGWSVGLEVGGARLRPGSGALHERRLLAALALAGYGDAG